MSGACCGGLGAVGQYVRKECLRVEGVEFSLSVSRNRAITTAIEAIDEHAYTPVHYPGAVEDPDTGALISDAEVAQAPLQSAAGLGPRDHRAAGGAPGQRRPLRVPRTRNGGLDVGRRGFQESVFCKR